MYIFYQGEPGWGGCGGRDAICTCDQSGHDLPMLACVCVCGGGGGGGACIHVHVCVQVIL